MTRHDLLTLHAHRGSPAVSLLMPTHRTSPDAQRDPIVLKNLLLEAEERLTGLLGEREAAPLLRSLHGQAAAIDLRRAPGGALAIFVAEGFAATHALHGSVEARVVIADRFATSDLVRDALQPKRYWLLVLAEGATRLYRGEGAALEEVRSDAFPMVHTGPGATASLPELADKAPYEEERLHHFYRRVAEAVAAVMHAEPLPLALMGVERALAHHAAVASGPEPIAVLTGSHDGTPAHELGLLVWPAVERGFTAMRERALTELDAAVGAQRSASGLVEVWRHAASGRGRTLLLEEGYRPSADDVEAPPLAGGEADALGVAVDAVSEVIEGVLAHGGEVVFVPDGTLAAHERVALTLRY